MQSMETESLLNDRRRGFVDRVHESYQGSENLGTSISSESTGSYHAQDITESQDDLTLLQACVFVEDAVHYRTIHHKVDRKSLRLYRVYYSNSLQWFLYAIIFTIHCLAFIEAPSSLTWTSDLRTVESRVTLPCGVTESLELFCLMVLLCDVSMKSYLKGKQGFRQSKWLWAYVLVIVVSLIDWCVTVGNGCNEAIRFRRILRPFFLLQNSSLMKKTVNSLRQTLPQVASVLGLLFMHLYFFTLFGMLLFPKDTKAAPPSSEQGKYFADLVESFMSLLVLLTTANNPDVTLPAYSVNRLYFIYFMVFLVIGLFCFMNMLTAVIYNQFRGYFLNSMQTSLFRRRLGIRAAFEILRRKKVSFTFQSSINTISDGVPARTLRLVIADLKNVSSKQKQVLLTELDSYVGCILDAGQFQEVFSVLETSQQRSVRPEIVWVGNTWLRILQQVCAHRYFTVFGCVVALANVISISVELSTEYDHLKSSKYTPLGILNLVFVLYYLIEQLLKLWALGWRRYVWDRGNIFDGVITVTLVIVEAVYVVTYGIPFWGKDHFINKGISLWDLVRIINMLIIFRLLRLITQIRAMYTVASTLLDLVKNLKAFAGILVVIYYSYAILGMELFRNKIKFVPPENVSHQERPVLSYNCGTYAQLEYWANNFDDFASSLVVLWDVMVVNNWFVFLDAYTKVTNGYSRIYFIVWWLISVVICLNLFTALILENFIMRWDRSHQMSQARDRSASSLSESLYDPAMTVHDMFRENLQEPSEDSLLTELRCHHHLQLAS